MALTKKLVAFKATAADLAFLDALRVALPFHLTNSDVIRTALEEACERRQLRTVPPAEPAGPALNFDPPEPEPEPEPVEDLGGAQQANGSAEPHKLEVKKSLPKRVRKSTGNPGRARPAAKKRVKDSAQVPKRAKKGR